MKLSFVHHKKKNVKINILSVGQISSSANRLLFITVSVMCILYNIMYV